MQLGCSAGSNKSIRSVVVIRRYIHLKGQACLKQTAEDICKYYIIYGMNILRLAGVREMNKHREVQRINEVESAYRWRLKGCSLTLFLYLNNATVCLWRVMFQRFFSVSCCRLSAAFSSICSHRHLSVCFPLCSLDGLLRSADFLIIISPHYKSKQHNLTVIMLNFFHFCVVMTPVNVGALPAKQLQLLPCYQCRTLLSALLSI